MADASPDGPAPLTMAVSDEFAADEDVDAGETVLWLAMIGFMLKN